MPFFFEDSAQFAVFGWIFRDIHPLLGLPQFGEKEVILFQLPQLCATFLTVEKMAATRKSPEEVHRPAAILIEFMYCVMHKRTYSSSCSCLTIFRSLLVARLLAT